MTQLTATFETGVNGSDVLVADAGSANAWDTRNVSAGSFKYDNAHVYDTLAATVVTPATGAACNMQWDASLGAPTDHFGRLYIWLNALPTGGDLRVFGCGDLEATFDIRTSGVIRTFQTAGGFVNDTTNAVATGQWVRIEWHIIHSATVGQWEIRIFNNADSVTPTETKTSAANLNTGANASLIRFGDRGGNTAVATFWLDNIIAGAASYPDPWSPPLPPTDVMLPGWSRTRFNG